MQCESCTIECNIIESCAILKSPKQYQSCIIECNTIESCAILKSPIGPIANASGSISQHLRTITSIDAIKRFAMRSFALLCTQCNELGIAFCNMLIVQYRCSIHSVQYSLVVETIGHVCFVPLVTNLFPLFHLLIIMPSSDISSLCHIHRNGSATRAFNNCYHNESLCSWIFTT